MSSWIESMKLIPMHMDYDGQGKAERISRFIITFFAVVGLVWGYIVQQFSQTIFTLIGGFVLASIITIPPWPMYRRKPLNWQKAQVTGSLSSEISTKSKKKK